MDNETLQAMRELLAEEREYTRQLFVAEREHTRQLFVAEREHTKQLLNPINESLDGLQQRTEKIEVTLEHNVAAKIQSVYEGHLLNTEKLDQIQASIDDMAPTVTALDVLHQMQRQQNM